MKSYIHHIDLNRLKTSTKEWERCDTGKCFPRNMEVTSFHVSILKPGCKPHEPHIHSDEELVLIIGGKAQVITKEENSDLKYTEKLGRGTVIYHESNNQHTIRTSGDEPAIYICLKWNSPDREKKQNKDILRNSFYSPEFIQPEKGYKTNLLFESKTEFLDKLHCHTSFMLPGAGYSSHRDDHDVIIFVLEGKLQTLNQTAGPNSVIFYRAGEEHGMKNIGDTPSKYIVFEFHIREKIKLKKVAWKLFKDFWE